TAAGAGTIVSYFRFSGFSAFSLGPLGATVGAAVSVELVTGGADALGALLSRSLFLPLPLVGAGVVTGGIEADGEVSGETFSFLLGAGEIFSLRLLLSFAGETDGLVTGVVPGAVEAPGLVGAFSEAWTVGGGTAFG